MLCRRLFTLDTAKTKPQSNADFFMGRIFFEEAKNISQIIQDLIDDLKDRKIKSREYLDKVFRGEESL